MKKAELTGRLLAGERWFVCEYRSGQIENMKWRDKVTQKPMEQTYIAHNVEIGPDSCQITEFLPDGVSPLTWKPDLKKGQMCVLHVDAFSREKGVYKGKGKLEPLID